jgi:hypothetical protein
MFLSVRFVQRLHGGESGDALPVADEASRFRGSGMIGRCEAAGNHIAATVGH